MEILEDLLKNSIVINCSGNAFYCASNENIECGVFVPKLSDILFNTENFKNKFDEYVYYKNLMARRDPNNPFSIYKLAQEDSFVKTVFNNRNLFVGRDLTEEERAKLRPLEKIMNNFYFGFADDYNVSQKIGDSEKVHIVIDHKWYQFNKNETTSFLFMKRDGDKSIVGLKLGNAVFGSMTSNMYESLVKLSETIVGLSNKTCFQNKDDLVVLNFTKMNEYQTLCDLCKVGTSDKLSQFRESKFGSDGKKF